MKVKITLAGMVIVMVALVAGSVLAQSGGGYNLPWSSIDGGSAVSSGGEYVLRGTIGQPDAGNLTGGGYTLAGGFWGQPVILSSVVSPPNAAPAQNYYIVHQVTLTWNSVVGATAYQVQVASDAAFKHIIYTSPELNALYVTTLWTNNGLYYWRVQAKNASGKWGAWSAVNSFTINAP